MSKKIVGLLAVLSLVSGCAAVGRGGPDAIVMEEFRIPSDAGIDYGLSTRPAQMNRPASESAPFAGTEQAKATITNATLKSGRALTPSS